MYSTYEYAPPPRRHITLHHRPTPHAKHNRFSQDQIDSHKQGLATSKDNARASLLDLCFKPGSSDATDANGDTAAAALAAAFAKVSERLRTYNSREPTTNSLPNSLPH